MSLSAADRAKCAAAARAAGLVEDGMRLGLGTGSTAAWFVRLVAATVRREGLSVTAVATSSARGWPRPRGWRWSISTGRVRST